MASQAQKYRKKIEEYEKLPFHDAKVLAKMYRQFDYANTIDHSVAKIASEILNGVGPI
jgi:hypothetical protein